MTIPQPQPNVGRPIFIFGTGRSGTTLFFHLLAEHPHLAWPCQYMLERPLSRKRRLARKLSRLPVVGGLVDPERYRRRPEHEPYEFWRKYYWGFNRPCRDLTADDVPNSMPAKVRSAVAQQTAAMGRPRFLTKYTGWSRIRFLDVIFPDALYINVVRDGRAVAWSLMNVYFWQGWRGPAQWRWGPLCEEDQELWERSDKSFFVLAGLQWKILMANHAEQGAAVGERYHEVRYEHLVARPQETLQAVLDFAALESSGELRAAIERRDIRDSNVKWKAEVPERQQELFQQLLGPTLERYGYGAEQPVAAR